MPDILNKLLWRSYFIVFIISLIILIVGFKVIWATIKEKEKSELIFSNKIISSSVSSLLHKNEELFKMIGNQIVKTGLFNAKEKTQTIITDLLISNPELAFISIVNLEGDVIVSTTAIYADNNSNVVRNKQTAKAFERALKLDYLVMGKTYFLKSIDQWVVPVLNKITDKQGKVVAILSTALKIKGNFNPWQNQNMRENTVLLVMDTDFYYQYISIENTNYLSRTYGKTLNEKYIEIFTKNLMEQTGYVFEDFFQGNVGVVSLNYPKPNTGEDLMAAISFNQKYQRLTLVIKAVASLHKKIWLPFGVLFVLLLLFNVILFSLFYYLNKLQIKSRKDLKYQAQHDQLTGLPNLTYLKDNFNEWKKRNNNNFSVVFIDIDDFKNSNDLHGHSVGDLILEKVSARIQTFFKNALAIRQGGDEFIILVPHNSSNNLFKMSQEFLDFLKQPIYIDDLEFTIRASLGISHFPINGSHIETLLSKADIAMYSAKRNKLGVKIFTNELKERNTRKATIGKELNNAILNNEFSLVYQPQIDSKLGRIVGVETLLRWNSNTLGNVSPEEFIPIAESTGAIIDIGEFVIKTALKEFHEFCIVINSNTSTDENNKGFRLSVNISILQLSEPNFTKMLFSCMEEFRCKNATLLIEITETLIIDNISNVISTLNKLRSAGIEISLDDFGTGYSSLSYLSQLPINELKIDKSFVHNISVSKQDIALVKSIINLGQSLGVRVLAEGVEKANQIKTLEKYGCHDFQGYYYSYPLDIATLLDFYKKFDLTSK